MEKQHLSNTSSLALTLAFTNKNNRETSGAKLADGGPAMLDKMLSKLASAGGGVLFVDEAYTLLPDGKQVLEILLAEMENRIVRN